MARMPTPARWPIVVMEAQVNLAAAGSEAEIKEAVADKGYHAAATLELAQDLNLRTYTAERANQNSLTSATGPISRPSTNRSSTPTGGASDGPKASGCSAAAVGCEDW